MGEKLKKLVGVQGDFKTTILPMINYSYANMYMGGAGYIISMYFTVFLTDVVNLSLNQAGIVVMIATVWDAVTDPVMGIMAGAPIGRDLRMVRQVLCVGGVFYHNKGPERRAIVERTFKNPGISLLPLEDPEIWFDDDYILYAMGVLAKHYPDPVLDYMKRNIPKNKN